MREDGEGLRVSADDYSCAHHVTRSPNKLWRSTSKFNLCFSCNRLLEHQDGVTAVMMVKSHNSLSCCVAGPAFSCCTGWWVMRIEDRLSEVSSNCNLYVHNRVNSCCFAGQAYSWCTGWWGMSMEDRQF